MPGADVSRQTLTGSVGQQLSSEDKDCHEFLKITPNFSFARCVRLKRMNRLVCLEAKKRSFGEDGA